MLYDVWNRFEWMQQEARKDKYLFMFHNVTEEIQRKIKTFVNRCLRYILRIWWPNIISNKDLWKVKGQEDINVEIKKKENLDGSVTH